jgi:predicted nuclease of predicted toxin-antitoxin system
VRLLLDEYLPPRIAVQLRLHGHDVVAMVERPDLHRSGDVALWAAACTERRMIVTQDVGDFVRLALQDAAIGRPHPGLVLIHPRWFSRGDRHVGRLVASLRALLTANPADDPLAGRIIWLEADAG